MANTQPETWTNQGLIEHIKDMHAKMPDRAFAFILGAGASRQSGIPTGGELVKRWLGELHRRLDPDVDQGELAAWATAENLGIEGFEHARAAEFYPQIFHRRFRDDPDEGYACLEEVMRGKRPSFGYTVLSQVMEKTPHKVVVTTNFDNLVADAMAMYTGNAALVVGHESLTGFVRPRLRRPLVAKIHRDLFYAPMNDPQGVSALGEGWARALKGLFTHFTPIVVGYGGNDGSLMNFLADLPEGQIPGRLIWTYRSGSPKPSGQIAEVIARHHGILAPIQGFDEFMLQLNEVFDFPLLADQIEQEAKDRAKQYREAVEAIQKRLATPVPLAENSAQAALLGSLESALEKQVGWWHWELKARSEPDVAKREALYREGLKEYPNSAELMGIFANFLWLVLKDDDEAERHYGRALELDANHANNTGNFAGFLWKVRNDGDKAERLFRRALELDPNDANHIGNFAGFLCEVRGDYIEAERLYRRALELDPKHTSNLAELLLIQGRFAEAEPLANQALLLNQGVFNDQEAGIGFNRAMTARLQNLDPTSSLASLKSLLQRGFARGNWSFDAVLDYAAKSLDAEEMRFWRALADAILDADEVAALEAFPQWQRVTPF